VTASIAAAELPAAQSDSLHAQEIDELCREVG
jgi:hypothetical protein